MSDQLSHKIKLTADTSQFNKQMAAAEQAVAKLDRAAGSGVAGLFAATPITAAIAAIGAAAIAAAYKFDAWAETFQKIGNAVRNLTAGMRIGRNEMMQYSLTAQGLGVNVGQAQNGIRDLDRQSRQEQYAGKPSQVLSYLRSFGIDTYGKSGKDIEEQTRALYQGLGSDDEKRAFLTRYEERGGTNTQMLTASKAEYDKLQAQNKKSAVDLEKEYGNIQAANIADMKKFNSELNAGATALPLHTSKVELQTLAIDNMTKALQRFCNHLDDISNFFENIQGFGDKVGKQVKSVFTHPDKFGSTVSNLFIPSAGSGSAMPIDQMKAIAAKQDKGSGLIKQAVPSKQDIVNDISRKLTAAGYSAHQIAGVVASTLSESQLDPTAVNPKTGAFGLYQYLEPRLTDLKAFAAKKGKPLADPYMQTDFMLSELAGKEKLAGRALAGSKTDRAATLAFKEKFERPYDKTMTPAQRMAIQADALKQLPTANALNAKAQGAATTNFNIQNMQVTAPDAKQFAASMQRAPQLQTMQSTNRG